MEVLGRLPHKPKPRLYMEAREPWRVVREMKGWEQAATAEARSFLHDLHRNGVDAPIGGGAQRSKTIGGYPPKG